MAGPALRADDRPIVRLAAERFRSSATLRRVAESALRELTGSGAPAKSSLFAGLLFRQAGRRIPAAAAWLENDRELILQVFQLLYHAGRGAAGFS
jgi:hypothetical protein